MTNMAFAFEGNIVFNSDLSKWNVASVVRNSKLYVPITYGGDYSGNEGMFRSMFKNCGSFNFKDKVDVAWSESASSNYRCENEDYNTQLACLTPGYWVDQNGNGYEICGYCPQGTWNGYPGCTTEHGNDLVTIIYGTYTCLYDVFFYSQSYTYKYTFLFHLFFFAGGREINKGRCTGMSNGQSSPGAASTWRNIYPGIEVRRYL